MGCSVLPRKEEGEGQWVGSVNSHGPKTYKGHTAVRFDCMLLYFLHIIECKLACQVDLKSVIVTMEDVHVQQRGGEEV